MKEFTMKTVVTDSGSQFPAFDVEIHPNKDKLNLSPLTLIILRERLDSDARRLSLLVPQGKVVVTTMARHKAVYENGERTVTRDFHDFYTNLTDEQYQNTQFLCSVNHKYV
jgi:hypothetical protein